VTSNHLVETVREQFGRTPGELIDERLYVEQRAAPLAARHARFGSRICSSINSPGVRPNCSRTVSTRWLLVTLGARHNLGRGEESESLCLTPTKNWRASLAPALSPMFIRAVSVQIR